MHMQALNLRVKVSLAPRGRIHEILFSEFLGDLLPDRIILVLLPSLPLFFCLGRRLPFFA